MTYDEFKDFIVTNIKKHLPDRYADSEVTISSVTKNNNLTLDSLCIYPKDSKIFPTIYLNEYFLQQENGRTLDDILSEIARIRQEHENPPDLDTEEITDFQSIKGRIRPKLVNAALNKDYLTDKPHTYVADLAVVYYIDFGLFGDCTASTVITDSLFSAYGTSIEELHQAAIGNISENGYFTSMLELLLEHDLPECPIEDISSTADEMFILTNKSKILGASQILSPATMDMVAERMGKADFVILPSSIHELILVPSRTGMDVDQLRQMVKEVNATALAKQDILSDNVYYYDLTQHELRLAV